MDVAIIIEVLVCGLMFTAVYRKGLRDGIDIKDGKTVEPMIKPSEKKETKPIELDERTEAILRNIDSYDGTSNGQQKIE